MSFDLTNKNIQDTFQNLLQKTGSEGKLFDLKGNEVRDLTIDGTLTVNSYITSESIVNTSSGSTAFGNSSDDSHTFQGSITASGNISSSGTINASEVLRNGTSVVTNITPSVTQGNFNQIKGGVAGIVQLADLGTTGNPKFNHITASGNISASGAINHNVHTFTDEDTTPSVSSGTTFKTANTSGTDITGFDNGTAGQIIYIMIQDNNTDFTDGTNLQLFGGLDHDTAQTNDTISFICVDGTKWCELNRSDNT